MSREPNSSTTASTRHHSAFGGDIHEHSKRPATMLTNLLGHRIGTFKVQVSDADRRARTRRCECNLFSQTACSTRHKSNLVRKIRKELRSFRVSIHASAVTARKRLL